MIRTLFFFSVFMIFSFFSCKKEDLAEKYDSNNYFIRVVDPAINSQWNKNSTYTINWTTNTDSKIKMELYLGENIVHTISPMEDNSGSYNWTIPHNLFPDTTYRIKITSLLRPGISGISQYFSVKGDSTIEFIEHSDFVSNNWFKGIDSLITWNDNIEEDVKIDLFLNDVFVETIVSATVSNGSFLWPVPSYLATNSNYKLRISSVANNSIFSFSDLFRISLLSEMNLVQNGNFISENYWVISNPTENPKYRWNIVTPTGTNRGTAETATLNSSGSISQELGLTIGQTYIINYSLSKSNGYFGGADIGTAAGIIPKIGTAAGTKRTQEGTYSDTLVADGTAIEFLINENLSASPNKGFICSLDNVEVIAQ